MLRAWYPSSFCGESRVELRNKMRCVRISWEPGEAWKKTRRRALWGPGRDRGRRLAFGNLSGNNAVFDEYSRVVSCAGKVGVKSGQEQ
jgi:hypothetical protein